MFTFTTSISVTPIFFFTGAALIISAIIIALVFHKKIHNCTVVAIGTVTGNRSGSSNINTTLDEISTKSYYPVFTYTVNGNTIHKISSVGYAKPIYTVGQQITIRYNPDNPNEFYIPEKIHNKLIAALSVAGISCIIFAVIALRLHV